jgi:hypothetical protein
MTLFVLSIIKRECVYVWVCVCVCVCVHVRMHTHVWKLLRCIAEVKEFSLISRDSICYLNQRHFSFNSIKKKGIIITLL